MAAAGAAQLLHTCICCTLCRSRSRVYIKSHMTAQPCPDINLWYKSVFTLWGIKCLLSSCMLTERRSFGSVYSVYLIYSYLCDLSSPPLEDLSVDLAHFPVPTPAIPFLGCIPVNKYWLDLRVNKEERRVRRNLTATTTGSKHRIPTQCRSCTRPSVLPSSFFSRKNRESFFIWKIKFRTSNRENVYMA